MLQAYDIKKNYFSYITNYKPRWYVTVTQYKRIAIIVIINVKQYILLTTG